MARQHTRGSKTKLPSPASRAKTRVPSRGALDGGRGAPPPVPSPLPANRIPFRLPLAILAGAVGTYFWDGYHTMGWNGLPFQALFLWLLWGAFPKQLHDPDPATPAAVPPKGPAKGPRRSPPAVETPAPWGRVVGLGAVLLLLAAASALLWNRRFETGSWVLAAAFGAVILAASRFQEDPAPRSGANEKFWLLGILAAGVLLRFPFVGKGFGGFQIDEANHLLDALRVMKGEIPSPFQTGWWSNPSMPYFLTAGWFHLFGSSLAAGRALSATYMTLAFVVFYRWVRLYFSATASLVSLALLVSGWWCLYFSLSPFTDALTVTCEVLAVYLLDTALRTGDRWRYFGCGLVTAAVVMTYISGRLVPVLLLLTWLGLMSFTKGFRGTRRWRGLLLSSIVFLWALGPFLLFMVHVPASLVGRYNELSIFNEMQSSGHYGLILKTYLWTAISILGSTLRGMDPRFGIEGVPLLDPVTAVLVVVGLGVTLTRGRSRATWFILPGFLVALSANALAIQGHDPDPDYINSQRYFMVLPFLYFMVARGVDWMRGLLARDPVAGGRRWAVKAALGAALAFAVLLNGRLFFHDIGANANCQDSMGFPGLEYGKMLKRIYPTHHILVWWEAFQANENFLVHDQVKVKVFDDKVPFQIPILNPVNRDVWVMFPDSAWKEQAAEIRKFYPEAVWNNDLKFYRQYYMQLVSIPKAAIDRERHGKPPVGDPLP